MARHVRFTFLLPLLLASALASQTAQSPLAPAGNELKITLGQSLVPLNGPWKFSTGDSPLDPKTHQPTWAQQDFDDTKWEKVDLTPTANSPDDAYSQYLGIVQGWSARGHSGYTGYAWYRIRIQLAQQTQTKLILMGPLDFDDAYQAFVNGAMIGEFGDFRGSKPVDYPSQPRNFPLTLPDSEKQATATFVLAFRLWMHGGDDINGPEGGGLRTAPRLGQSDAADAQNVKDRLFLFRLNARRLAESILWGAMAIFIFCLAFIDRSDRVYMWIGTYALILLVTGVVEFIAVSTVHISAFNYRLEAAFLVPLTYFFFPMVWWVWLGRPRPSWIPRLVLGLTLLEYVEVFSQPSRHLVPPSWVISAMAASLQIPLNIAFEILMFWIVFQGIRKRGIEGWLVLPVVASDAVAFFAPFFHLYPTWNLFGISFTLDDISSLVDIGIIVLLLLRRLMLSLRLQRLMALDVKQAQEVQQVILPESRATLGNLAVETEYRPAREVGGDFFQVIPHESDGSLLIVAGDVTGKGLKAGMLVALLIGAIRTAAETAAAPLLILQILNRRLMGRGDAQATCLALRISAAGEATLANAGHMPPYLNGEPLDMEGALPLGMIEAADFSLMRFELHDHDKLVLMSDGIAEATDVHGHLFGFDRIKELLSSTTSAAEVARAAQAFGQEDDISVISVTRTPMIGAEVS